MQTGLGIVSISVQAIACILAGFVGRRMRFKGIGWVFIALILNVAQQAIRLWIVNHGAGFTILFVSETIGPLLESFCYVWAFTLLIVETQGIHSIRIASDKDRHGPEPDTKRDGQ